VKKVLPMFQKRYFQDSFEKYNNLIRSKTTT
jgi:hypothetical protein